MDRDARPIGRDGLRSVDGESRGAGFGRGDKNNLRVQIVSRVPEVDAGNIPKLIYGYPPPMTCGSEKPMRLKISRRSTMATLAFVLGSTSGPGRFVFEIKARGGSLPSSFAKFLTMPQGNA